MIATVLSFLGLNKVSAVVIELVVFAAVVAGVCFYVAHLHEKAAKYDVLYAQVVTLEHKYACAAALPICLAGRDEAAAKEQARLQTLATQERQRAEELNTKLMFDSNKTIQAIEQSTAQDGALPAIMQQEWDRERAERGEK